jgi:hypothetical protein
MNFDGVIGSPSTRNFGECWLARLARLARLVKLISLDGPSADTGVVAVRRASDEDEAM